jgi:hypothetical protein
LLAARLLSSLLFGVAATDSRTLLSAAAAVLVLGVLATYLPARRAATLALPHLPRGVTRPPACGSPACRGRRRIIYPNAN